MASAESVGYDGVELVLVRELFSKVMSYKYMTFGLTRWPDLFSYSFLVISSITSTSCTVLSPDECQFSRHSLRNFCSPTLAHSSYSSTVPQTLSTEPIPLTTSERDRSLILPSIHRSRGMCHRSGIAVFLSTRRGMIAGSSFRRAGFGRSRRRSRRNKFLHTHFLADLAAFLFRVGSFGTVGVDAAFGEVVGAAAGDDENAPAIPHRA